MAFKIKFYELFLKEKEYSLINFKNGLISDDKITNKMKNEFLVHEFLELIVEDIEIVYDSPDGNSYL